MRMDGERLMAVGDLVRVIGDSEWNGHIGEVVEPENDGFIKVRFSVWGNSTTVRMWKNHLRKESATLY